MSNLTVRMAFRLNPIVVAAIQRKHDCSPSEAIRLAIRYLVEVTKNG